MLYFIVFLQTFFRKVVECSMQFNSNKEKGNAGLGLAIAYFSANGYTVSIPLNDTQDYDIIIEKSDIVFAFWDEKSRGTKYVIDKCKKIKHPIRVFVLNKS